MVINSFSYQLTDSHGAILWVADVEIWQATNRDQVTIVTCARKRT